MDEIPQQACSSEAQQTQQGSVQDCVGRQGDFILNPADLTHSLTPTNSPAPGHRCPTGLPRITRSDTEDKGHQQGLVTSLLFF